METKETMDIDPQVKNIIRQGDYWKIYEELKQSGFLDAYVLKLREQYSERFEARGFAPDQKIWEMMVIEDLYDSPTLSHGVRTFEIADGIAKKILTAPNGEKINLEKLMEDAGVSPYDIRIAALEHDIGKLKIPLEVLHNTLSDDDMNQILIDMIHRGVRKKEIFERIGMSMENDSTASDEEIISKLFGKGLRAVNVVPLSEAFPEEKHPGFTKILEERGFSSEQTIKQIAVAHESAGKEIFEAMGEPVIADIVGHHHNYQKTTESEMRYKIKIPALHVAELSDEFGVCNIVKIADQLDSLQSARPYKKSMTKLAAFAELTHQAGANRLEKRFLYLLIDNEYGELKEKLKNGSFDEKTMEEENKSLKRVEEFLNETKNIFTAK